MLLRVPLAFRATVAARGGGEDVMLGEWHEVHVAELDGSEAPVALSWADDRRGGVGAPGGVHRTRWFDDSHWQPALVRSAGAAAHLDAGALEAMCAAGRSAGNPLSAGLTFSTDNFARGHFGTLSDMPEGAVLSSGFESARDAAEARAREAILVDGEVWTRRDEPVYELKGRLGAGAYEFFVVTGNRSAGEASCVWRADRHDEMCALMRSLDDGFLGGFKGGPEIEVHLPESVRFDDDTPATLSALCGLSLLKPTHPDMDAPERAGAVGAFRDAAARASRAPTRQNARRLADAASDYLRFGFASDGDFAAVRIRNALARRRPDAAPEPVRATAFPSP